MCGIFGYIKQKPEPFDFTTFCTLGIHNDTRGKDSVGICIDNKLEYYFEGKGTSLFEDFIANSNLLQNTKECQFAFGHCRKASVGAIDINSAQPVVLKNEQDEIEYILMHNGTIFNYEDLAKKYIPNINIKGLTDSQVMARIFYHSGYDALAEYIGGAVFAIIDYRDDETKYLFWQGSSKSYSTSTKEEEERPLEFAVSKDGELLFSSLNTFFNALRPESSQFKIKSNVLAEFVDGDLYVVKSYDRSNVYQNEIIGYRGNYYYSSWNNNYQSNKNSTKNNITTNKNSHDGYVYFSKAKGKCFLNDKIMHGKYNISPYGRVTPIPEQITNEMYFYEGILLKNKAAFTWLEEFTRSFGETHEKVYETLPELVLYLSPYPYKHVVKNGLSTLIEVTSPVSGYDFTGDVIYPFTKEKMHYENGIFQDSKMITFSSDSLDKWKEHKNDLIDYEILTKF